MKSLRSIFIGVTMLGLVVFLCGLAFAQEAPGAGKANHEAKIKLLQDSAVVLQQSNPELAKKLNDLADKEAKQMETWRANREARVKLLNDAAFALQKSNPDLAKGLQGMTEGRYKKGMQQMLQEKNEREEAGETTEPKSEQSENTQ